MFYKIRCNYNQHVNTELFICITKKNEIKILNKKIDENDSKINQYKEIIEIHHLIKINKTLTGHTSWNYALAILPNNNYIVSIEIYKIRFY